MPNMSLEKVKMTYLALFDTKYVIGKGENA